MSKELPAKNGNNSRNEDSKIVNASVLEYSGIVPPPGFIDVYEHNVPGATERFLRMAELEQQHRFAIDKEEIALMKQQESNDVADFRLGLYASTSVMVLLFIFMGICAFLRLESALIAALGVPLVGSIGSVIAQFLWRKKR